MAAGDGVIFFQNNGAAWHQQQKLTLSSGFGNDIALGSDFALVAFRRQESVYAYTKSATGWMRTDTLRPTFQDLNAGFGQSVDVSGDTAIIGQPFSESPGTVHIFERQGSTWSRTTRLQASDGSAFDQFGIDVAISGNLAAVAATGGEMGRVYLFEKQDSIWRQRGHFSSGANWQIDQFGGALAISGTALAVGARLDDLFNPDSGSIYIFHIPEPDTGILTLAASSLLILRRPLVRNRR